MMSLALGADAGAAPEAAGPDAAAAPEAAGPEADGGPFLLLQVALLWPTPLQVPHLITVPTLHILVLFGFSVESLLLSFFGLLGILTYGGAIGFDIRSGMTIIFYHTAVTNLSLGSINKHII